MVSDRNDVWGRYAATRLRSLLIKLGIKSTKYIISPPRGRITINGKEIASFTQDILTGPIEVLGKLDVAGLDD